MKLLFLTVSLVTAFDSEPGDSGSLTKAQPFPNGSGDYSYVDEALQMMDGRTVVADEQNNPIYPKTGDMSMLLGRSRWCKSRDGQCRRGKFSCPHKYETPYGRPYCMSREKRCCYPASTTTSIPTTTVASTTRAHSTTTSIPTATVASTTRAHSTTTSIPTATVASTTRAHSTTTSIPTATVASTTRAHSATTGIPTATVASSTRAHSTTTSIPSATVASTTRAHSTTTYPDCPEGFFKLKDSEKYYCIFHDYRRTWFNATSKCEAYQLILAEPQDPVAMTSYLTTTYGLVYWTWLGARGNGDAMAWESDGDLIINNNSSYWRPGRPEGRVSDKYCAVLQTTPYGLENYPNNPYDSIWCDNNRQWTLCESTGPTSTTPTPISTNTSIPTATVASTTSAHSTNTSIPTATVPSTTRALSTTTSIPTTTVASTTRSHSTTSFPGSGWCSTRDGECRRGNYRCPYKYESPFGRPYCTSRLRRCCYPGKGPTSTTPTPTQCPEGLFRAEYSEQCFLFLMDIQRNWTDAKKKCEYEGYSLAEPQDPLAVRSYIVNNYDPYWSTWLGAQGDRSSLRWLRSGEAISNSDPLWRKGDPGIKVTPNHKLVLGTSGFHLSQYNNTPFKSYPGGYTRNTLCELVLN